jgi:hypothetical protein
VSSALLGTPTASLGSIVLGTAQQQAFAGLATWQGPFDDAQVYLPNAGQFFDLVQIGQTINVGAAGASALATADPGWWVFS